MYYLYWFPEKKYMWVHAHKHTLKIALGLTYCIIGGGQCTIVWVSAYNNNTMLVTFISSDTHLWF